MRAWAEINLDSIAHNILCIREKIGKDTKLLTVIKADAYGHGYEEVAKTAIECGVDFFGVATCDEALQIRKSGFDVPVLILGTVEDDEYESLIGENISLTVFSRAMAETISEAAQKLGKTVRLHIKLDTGMSRIGYMADEAADKAAVIDEIIGISRLKNIEIEGIFTHFSKADEPEEDFTHIQFKRFMDICGGVEERGLKIPLRHCCNSGGILHFPEYHLDMVRSGIITYGCMPSDNTKTDVSLIPTMMLKSKVTDVKRIGPGVGISYGGTYETDAPADIATFGIGYADGYFRCLSNKGQVIIGGEIANVVGRVCMDQTMADVTHVKNVKIGDEVILFGTDGNNTITVDSVAALAGTISYEVLSVVGRRIPRVYIKGGKVIKVLNYMV